MALQVRELDQAHVGDGVRQGGDIGRQALPARLDDACVQSRGIQPVRGGGITRGDHEAIGPVGVGPGLRSIERGRMAVAVEGDPPMVGDQHRMIGRAARVSGEDKGLVVGHVPMAVGDKLPAAGTGEGRIEGVGLQVHVLDIAVAQVLPELGIVRDQPYSEVDQVLLGARRRLRSGRAYDAEPVRLLRTPVRQAVADEQALGLGRRADMVRPPVRRIGIEGDGEGPVRSDHHVSVLQQGHLLADAVEPRHGIHQLIGDLGRSWPEAHPVQLIAAV